MIPTPLSPSRLGLPLLPVLVVSAVCVYILLFVWGMDSLSYDIWGGMLVAPLLVLATTPVAVRAAARAGEPRLATLLVAALVVKLIGTVIRYVVAFDVYGGAADAVFYHDWGVQLAEAFRDGDWDAGRWGLVGTGFIQRVTGVVYLFTGPTQLGGFFVFSWLGFWGLYFFYQAFVQALPEGNHRRYALLIFFLPSFAFWPSSIGKEAWMMFGLGLTALGAARLLSRRPGGFALVALGMLGAGMVRPHVTLLTFAALALGYLLRRAPRLTLFGPVVKIVGVTVLVVGGMVLVNQVESFFGVDSVSGDSVDEVLERTNTRSAQGGSRFNPPNGRNPVELPLALVTVLYRPFPHEAHNAQALAASMESLLLLALTVVSVRRLLAGAGLVGRRAYVAFAAGFLVLFVVAFSHIGNFGIIARQRVQVLPFLLVLLCLPMPGGARRTRAPEPAATTTS